MADFITAHLPWFWVGVMVICIVIEACTFSLTTIWFACGSLVLVFISWLPLPFRWQLLLFMLISLSLLIFTRPIVAKKFHLKKTATNSDSLIGKRVIVTEDISALKKGAIKDGGLTWSAKTADNSSLNVGDECIVDHIEGVTAVVRKA